MSGELAGGVLCENMTRAGGKKCCATSKSGRGDSWCARGRIVISCRNSATKEVLGDTSCAYASMYPAGA